MLGWHFIVHKSPCKESAEAPNGRPTQMAVWQADGSGLGWLDQLVGEKKAISLGGDGYPYRFTAMAKYLKTVILGGPPYARSAWGFEHGDILTSGWKGRTGIDQNAWETCDPDEWLSIDVWDES